MMFRLPVLADEGAMGVTLSEKEKGKVKILNAALTLSSNPCTLRGECIGTFDITFPIFVDHSSFSPFFFLNVG